MNPLLTKLPYLWRPWSWACASPGSLGTTEEFLSMKIWEWNMCFFLGF